MALPAADAGSAARPHAARDHLHHRHVGLDGRRVDRAGDAKRCCWRSTACSRATASTSSNSTPSRTPLFSAPMPVDDATLRKARGVRARPARTGGTEMLPALQLALAGERESTHDAPGRVPHRRRGRQRGCAPAAACTTRLGDRRLFTIGIGPAPNTFFLTKAAQFGRGTLHVHRRRARSEGEDDRAVPQARKPGADRHRRSCGPAAPTRGRGRLPDLYAGEPVVRDGPVSRRARSPGNVVDHGQARRRGVGARCSPLDGERQRARRGGAVGAREDRRADGCEADRRAAGRRNARRRARCRADAPSRQQVHEPRRGRRDADARRPASQRSRPRCRATSPKA